MRKLLLILWLFPTLAMAAGTEVHDPTSDIYAQWFPSSGTDHYALLNDDSDATRDSLNDNAQDGYMDMFQFGNTAIADSTIDSTKFYIRFNTSHTGNTVAILDSIPGVAVRQGSDITGISGYYDYSATYTTSPDGGAWSWTDIDNLMAGFVAVSIVNKQEVYISEIWFTVYYRAVAVGGGQVIMIMGGN